MKTKKKLGIWMDHANAHLMEHTDPIITTIITSDSTHEEKQFTLQKGESFMQRKNQLCIPMMVTPRTDDGIPPLRGTNK